MSQICRVVLIAGVSGLMLLPLSGRTAGTKMPPIVNAESQPAVQIAPFTSIELQGGVKAVLNHGLVHRVSLLKGDPDITQISVTGERLFIEKCRDKCPRGYEAEIAIVAPLINAISVGSGGTIESRGNFPLHTSLSLAVAHGGTIDARPISSTSITAAVSQGGRIFAKPHATMAATVSNGGVITYWGEAQVTSSTRHGGAVTKGQPVDADKPLSDFEGPISCPSHPDRPASPKRSRTIVI